MPLRLNPGLIETEMTDQFDFSFMPTKMTIAGEVARAGIKNPGGKSQVVPGFMNNFIKPYNQILPDQRSGCVHF